MWLTGAGLQAPISAAVVCSRAAHKGPSRDDVSTQLQVNSLRELVEDWDFQEGPFMEFVAPALQLLAGLLHTSGELETQLQVRYCRLPTATLCMGLCNCTSGCLPLHINLQHTS